MQAATGRQVALDHLKRRVGYTEQPANSNCDSRVGRDPHGAGPLRRRDAGCATSPGAAAGASTRSRAAGFRGSTRTSRASAQIEDFARAGQKCYRGWTTDRSKVKPGDLVIIGGYGVHVETVRGVPGSDGQRADLRRQHITGHLRLPVQRGWRLRTDPLLVRGARLRARPLPGRVMGRRRKKLDLHELRERIHTRDWWREEEGSDARMSLKAKLLLWVERARESARG